MKQKSIVLLLLWIVFLGPSILWAKTLQNTVQTLHETYEKINDMEADFSQAITFEGFDTTSNSRGKVYFKRGQQESAGVLPLQGKMRWDYIVPTRDQIFIESETVLHYTPENKQVIRSVLGKQTGLPIDLFFNIEKMEALFNLSQIKENTVVLKPKEKGSQLTKMVLTLAPLPKVGGLFISQVVLHEENGNQSLFKFKNFRMNKRLSEQTFSFTLPEGVEIINLE